MEEAKSDGEKIVEKLVKSFSDLERAIDGARTNLLKAESVPEAVFSRLDNYNLIIEKQRALTRDMEKYVNAGNLPEVSRHIGLINGLSSMIIDDARGILVGLGGDSPAAAPDDISNFC